MLGAPGLMAGGTGPFSVHSGEPAADLWMYQHAGSPGTRAAASTFSALPEVGFGADDRFAQFLIKFNTVAAGIPAGLGAENYDPSRVALTCVIGVGGSFVYDPTEDPLSSHLSTTDPDPGRVIEVHGAAFRNGLTAATFQETSPYSSNSSGSRNAYPLGYSSEGVARDVSNNVTSSFESIPWAVAKVLTRETEESPYVELVPGATVPRYAHAVFELNLALPGVSAYVRDSLNQGYIWLVVSSLHSTTEQAAGGYPSFFTKEDVEQLYYGDVAPTLDVTYTLPLRISSFTRDSVAATSRIAWNGSPGFSYRIERTEDLNTGIWEPAGTRTTNTPVELEWTGPAATPRSFFRISRTPLP